MATDDNNTNVITQKTSYAGQDWGVDVHGNLMSLLDRSESKNTLGSQALNAIIGKPGGWASGDF